MIHRKSVNSCPDRVLSVTTEGSSEATMKFRKDELADDTLHTL